MTDSTPTLYGIPNCDTVKRARAWLADQGIACVFHDFKKQGVPPDQLEKWIDAVGWERLLNQRGTTWRQLDEPARARVSDRKTAAEVMISNPSVIKRPVVDWGTGITVGFDAEDWAKRQDAK